MLCHLEATNFIQITLLIENTDNLLNSDLIFQNMQKKK